MFIVKMGQDSMMSNEAVVRVVADNISSFPKTKRAAAMTAFKKAAKQELQDKQKAIDTGKNAKGKKIKELTLNTYKGRVSDIKDVISMIGKVKPKNIDDILTPAALSELKGITSVNVITSLIMTGKPNEVGAKKRKPSYSPSGAKAVPKALLGDSPTPEQIGLLNAGVVTDLITEPQLEGVPQRSVFVVQGIDVINPGVLETNHPNYPMVFPRGPKG